MILGAVLAGGMSSRFGSDKALAELDGQSLLVRAIDALGGWCEHVVVVGRALAPAPTLPDWPRPGMGPLGGLGAALNHALDQGYDTVLTIGVDCIGLPDDLPDRLSPAPGYLAALPVVGLWPAGAAGALAEFLASSRRHAVFAFADSIGARPVTILQAPANINTPADLQYAERRLRHGSDG